MIAVVEGAVGAGKTYWVVDYLAKHLRYGGIAATNLSLSLPDLRRLTGRRLSSTQLLQISASTVPSQIPRGDLRGHGRRRVLVVLDEALNWFPSSTSKDEGLRCWSEWLRQSDKLGQDVFFIAQRFDRAAKWLRELAQLCISVKNFGQIRWLGIPVGRLLGLRRVSAYVRWDLTIQQRVGWGLYTLRPEVWRCYDTAVLYGFSASDNAYGNASGVWPSHYVPRLPIVIGFVFFGVSLLRYLWVAVV